MNNIPSARSSPRIVNGVIKWYERDTFSIDIELELTDQDGEKVEVKPTDVVEVNIYNRSDKLVTSFVRENVANNTITIDIDKETTKLFTAGEYHYDVIVEGESRTTIARNNDIIVE